MNLNETSKLQRKASLSLSTRLNQKRHSASPQNLLRASISSNSINARELVSNCETLQRSPSVMSICSDGGIECTPPPKKMARSYDDSPEFSPRIFDSSFSPTGLLSQTLAIDSPEVGWKWSRHSVNAGSGDPICGAESSLLRTPDSAYAADSSFASAGSSSTEVAGNAHIRADSYKQRNSNDARRDERKMLEQELRRVEKTRAEEQLKQRCAKLREQLKSAGTQKSKTKCQLNEKSCKKITNTTSNSSLLSDVEMKSETSRSTSPNAGVKFQAIEEPKKAELLKDFFNDTDSDCVLLEATQEIESKIEAKTQPAFINLWNTTSKSSTSKCTPIPRANTAPADTSTPPEFKGAASIAKTNCTSSENKEKRSSLYMKFLEDDCLDDWFVSLDETILQVSQNKKQRNSLQRYKSMPAETAIKSNVILNKDNNDNCIMDSKINSSKHHMILSEGTTGSTSTLSKMKRHSSTHTLSPAGTNYRSRRQL